MSNQERTILLTTINNCDQANNCGFVKFLVEKGKASIDNPINCGKKEAESCARHPENPRSWVQLEATTPKTREELEVIFPNGRYS